MSKETNSTASAPSLAVRLGELANLLLWLCPAIGLIAGAVILWAFGLTPWTAAAVIFLIACPVVVVWVLLIARQQTPNSRRRP